MSTVIPKQKNRNRMKAMRSALLQLVLGHRLCWHRQWIFRSILVRIFTSTRAVAGTAPIRFQREELTGTSSHVSNKTITTIYKLFSVNLRLDGLVITSYIKINILDYIFVCLSLCNSEQPSENLASESEKRAQRYYQSCVDVNKTRQSLGSQPVLDLLDLLGGWPATASSEAMTETDENKWNFQEAIQIAHNVLNTDGFFKWELGPAVSKEFDEDTEEISISTSYIIKVMHYFETEAKF